MALAHRVLGTAWILLVVNNVLNGLLPCEALIAPKRRRISTGLLYMYTREPLHFTGSKWYSSYIRDPDPDDYAAERELRIERPTETMTERPDAKMIPSHPKIVVLGASGKIGRLVIQKLLDSSDLSNYSNAIIVAVVRDYDNACRVLFDARITLSKRRPTLQIVQADLVQLDDDNQLQVIDSHSNNNCDSLQEAIRGCTAIISCVGSVRPTNFWTDFLERPFWRLLRKDVSSWCNDSRHPYYTHYKSTKNVLALAENEQLRREAAAVTGSPTKEQLQGADKPNDRIPRIRFVRVSDVCVAQQPWHFIPLLTNAIHSMVFRYQDMAEQLLESSQVIDTVILRPGDLTDEDRDEETTGLQVRTDGWVAAPTRVGRDDVASLAVASSLFDSRQQQFRAKRKTLQSTEGFLLEDRGRSFHYTLAVRWVGDQLHPYPAQGRKSDGLIDARSCLRKALQSIRRQELLKQRKRLGLDQTNSSSAVKLTSTWPFVWRRRRLKPWGLCVAVPVYTMFLALARSLLIRMSFPSLKILLMASPFGNLFEVARAAVVSQLSAAMLQARLTGQSLLLNIYMNKRL
jgi:hypothetical protein